MHFLMPLFMLTLINLGIAPAAMSQDSILGTWQAPEMENMTIQVYEAQDGYIYGKITAADEPDWVDKIILKKASFDEKQTAWVGEIYSLRAGMNVDVVMTLEEAEKLKIVGSRFGMSRTFYWVRK
ncbi:MAG: hypothetical protein AAFR61_20350 [Bacteroidota bacterium]